MGVLSQIWREMPLKRLHWPAKGCRAYGSLSLSSILKKYASTGQSIRISDENARVSSRVMILSFITYVVNIRVEIACLVFDEKRHAAVLAIRPAVIPRRLNLSAMLAQHIAQSNQSRSVG